MLTCLRMKEARRFLNFVIFSCLVAGQIAAKEYIVKLRHDLDEGSLTAFEHGSGSVKITDTHKDLKLVKVDYTHDSPSESPENSLMEYFDAEYVVENVLLHAFVDSDPRRSEQWALDIVKAREAFQISTGSRDVVVAVLDTGIDINHIDLAANIWRNNKETAGNGVDDDNNGYIDDINGWDFFGNDQYPNDETSAQNPGHGTHCAGIIGAACDNNEGICGMSPHVSLMALRFLGADGSGNLFDAIKAIDYAKKNGAHIISASWGASMSESQAQPLIDAIKSLEEAEIFFVAAAGNEGRSNDSKSIYPANARTRNLISVAASDEQDHKTSWSNYGSIVTTVAPGNQILSTTPENNYDELSGTSMATPLVAGLLALMKSLDASLTGPTARAILQSTGDPVDIDVESKRRINAYEAVKAVSERKLVVIPAAHTFDVGEQYDFSAWGGESPYRFSSLNPDIATIDETGHFTAVNEGEVIIEVLDSKDNRATTVNIQVGHKTAPDESSCPFPNEFLCLILCGINPQLPWCKALPELPDLPFPIPTP
jgi:thermitase